MNKLLPKGFKYTLKDEILKKNEILNVFIRSALDLKAELIEFPSVAFLKTFQKGANLVGEKIFHFKDKKNRELVLTPDSMAHIYNYHLHIQEKNKKCRYAWISPTYRYRNIKNRFFTQIGLTSINSPTEREVYELFELLLNFIDTIKNITPDTPLVKIVYPRLFLNVINEKGVLGDQKNLEIFNRVRLANSSDLKAIIESFLKTKSLYNEVANLFHTRRESLSQISHLNSSKELLFFCQKLNEKGVEFELELDSFYCSEILSGIGFIIYSKDLQKIGDGGIYSHYGARYDASLKSVISLCTGLDGLIGNR